MIKKDGNDTVSSVWRLVEPIAENMGLEIWDVRFIKEGSNWYLRIFIDKEDGVTIDDCETLSRAIDGPLDELDPINVPYCLEVSSPGLQRQLTRKEHFEKYLNERVIVKFIRPIHENQKEILATLKSFENNEIILELESKEFISVNKKNLAYVKLDDLNI